MLSIENPVSEQIAANQVNLTKSDALNNAIKGQSYLKKRVGQFIYTFSQMIGYGYSSKVYKGYRGEKMDEIFAIKVIKLKKLNEVEFKLFKNEIKVLKNLKHQNIIKCYDFHLSKNHAYIITQYCEGGTLEQYIKNQNQRNSMEQLNFIFSQIVSGLKYLQEQRILHRDIKPANIFLKQNKWKIGDFGFAHVLTSNQTTFQDKFIVGSPLFMPPESLQKFQYSFKTDCFALGVTYFYMVTRQYPWTGKTVSQILSAYESQDLPQQKLDFISENHKQIIISLCELDPNMRMNILELQNPQKIIEDVQKKRLKSQLKLQQLNKIDTLSLIEKVRLCKFVIFLWENLYHFQTFRNIRRGVRKIINYVIGQTFKGKNVCIVKQHFPIFQYNEKLKFKNHFEFVNLCQKLQLKINQLASNNKKQLTQIIYLLNLSQLDRFLKIILRQTNQQLQDLIKEVVLHPDFRNVSPTYRDFKI